MRAYERFMRYIQFDTASDDMSPSCPSTQKQLVLGRALVEEMLQMGISDARIDENGYVYGSIPATAEGFPDIGLIAHMDTVDDVPAAPMNARIVENYDGGDVQLSGGDILSPRDYPELKLRRQGFDRHRRQDPPGRGRQGGHRRNPHRLRNAARQRQTPRQGLHRHHPRRGDRPGRGSL